MTALRTLSTAAAILSAALLGSPAACSRAGPGPREMESAQSYRLDVAVNGLSGLTRDDRGALWGVSEREVTLVEIANFRVAGAFPVRGMPEGAEAESLTWLGGRRFALGTERNAAARTSDALLFVEAGEDGAAVTSAIDLDYAGAGMVANGNEGIEGLCRAGQWLVAAIETALPEGEARVAVIAILDTEARTWSFRRLRLTTQTGKLSALECRQRGAQIEAIAVERHFEVAHLLGFDVDPTMGISPEPIAPRLLKDLAPARSGYRNFEGVTWLADNRIALLVDNQWRGITGPNELVVVDLTVERP